MFARVNYFGTFTAGNRCRRNSALALVKFVSYRWLSHSRINNKMCSNITKPFTVFVEGNIGSGKTTFLEHFRQFEDITLLTEPVEEWRDLKGYNLLVRNL